MLAGIAIVLLGCGYFFLLGTSGFQEPGESLEYDLKEFDELDNVPTEFAEDGKIALSVENPRALAVAGDKVYVAGQDAVAVYAADGRETARHKLPGLVSALAVDAEGTLFAGMQNFMVVAGPDGTAKGEWRDAFNARSFITAVALDGEDVYAADAGNRVVVRFDRTGKEQARIGTKDDTRDVPGLEVPSPYLDLAVNPDGDLWVVNPGKLGLEQFRPDGSIVTSWYKPTVLRLDGFPGCCNPTHVAFNSKGQLFTAEKGMVRVKQFEVTAGTFEGLVAPSELFPHEQSVRDLAVDAQDRVLVLDAKQNAVRVFARKEAGNGSAPQPA